MSSNRRAYEVRIRYFEQGYLTISFGGPYLDMFKDKILTFHKKGSRLYMKVGNTGLKCTSSGTIKVSKEAQDYRQFEGEYSLLLDKITERYYIDLQQVRPLTILNKVRNITSEPNVLSITSNGIVVKKTRSVIDVLKETALNKLIEGKKEDAEILAKAFKILEEDKNEKAE